jgi:hypothetical protein
VNFLSSFFFFSSFLLLSFLRQFDQLEGYGYNLEEENLGREKEMMIA